jgi:hypothetical protein
MRVVWITLRLPAYLRTIVAQSLTVVAAIFILCAATQEEWYTAAAETPKSVALGRTGMVVVNGSQSSTTNEKAWAPALPVTHALRMGLDRVSYTKCVYKSSHAVEYKLCDTLHTLFTECGDNHKFSSGYDKPRQFCFVSPVRAYIMTSTALLAGVLGLLSLVSTFFSEKSLAFVSGVCTFLLGVAILMWSLAEHDATATQGVFTLLKNGATLAGGTYVGGQAWCHTLAIFAFVFFLSATVVAATVWCCCRSYDEERLDEAEAREDRGHSPAGDPEGAARRGAGDDGGEFTELRDDGGGAVGATPQPAHPRPGSDEHYSVGSWKPQQQATMAPAESPQDREMSPRLEKSGSGADPSAFT